MRKDEIRSRLEVSIDKLAAIEHERWAHWQRYVHEKANRQPDGSIVIPADIVRRWESQISTHYADLSEYEKESDREQVRKFIPAIVEALVRE